MQEKVEQIRIVLITLFGGFLILMASEAHSEIYKWTDDSGKTHFSDQSPTDSTAEQLEVNINSYTAGKYSKSQSKKVVMYSATWCGVCKEAKRYFEDNDIAYREYDMENSEKGRRDFKKYKGKGVALILVDHQRMIDFNV